MEASPKFEATDFESGPEFRLCRIRVLSVGQGLPCLGLADASASELYYSSSNITAGGGGDLPDDAGSIDLGPACPLNYPNGGPDANQLKVQAVWNYVGTPVAGAGKKKLLLLRINWASLIN